MDVAFLGLGRMGHPMCIRTGAAARGVLGGRVRGWNRTPLPPGRARALADAGVALKETARACVQGADVVVTVVSDAEALVDVLAGEAGVADALAAGALVVDMSTLGRAGALRAGALVAARGVGFVDAPVSGTVGPAERGELVALVGGHDADVARAEPVLRAMCKRVVRAGGPGQGQALKVLLNGVGAHQLAGFVSMLALGERAGLDRGVVLEAFAGGAFATPSFQGKVDKLRARDYAPEFSLELTRKDVRLGVELAEELGAALPVQRAILAEVSGAVDAGLGAEDIYALEKFVAARLARGGRPERG